MEDKELCNKLGLKQTELEQLRTYIEWAEESGTYWRPKNQFDARHDNICKALGIPVKFRF